MAGCLLKQAAGHTFLGHYCVLMVIEQGAGFLFFPPRESPKTTPDGFAARSMVVHIEGTTL